MVTSTGVLLIVIGGTVEASVTLNEWSPSRAVSSMIDTIAHAMSSFTPGVNVISSGSAAEKSSPNTINTKKEKKVGSGHVSYTSHDKEEEHRRSVCEVSPLSTM